MRDSPVSPQARFFLVLDSLGKVVRFPVSFLIWLLKGLYLAGCMLSWALIVWALGEKHVGILKVLILLASGFVWGVILVLAYWAWT